jgi:uncharacterized RDD family membrane protein YckC
VTHAAGRPHDPRAAGRARAVAARVHEPVAPAAPAPTYVGLVTRAIAFSLDAALVNLIALIVAVAVGLALSIFSIPDELVPVFAAIGAALWLVWAVAYFVTFWSTTGQTPGNRLLRIKVVRALDGGVPRPRQSLVRFVGLTLAAIPLFAGFLPILFDARRRGLQDMLARTVVISADGAAGSPAATDPAEGATADDAA